MDNLVDNVFHVNNHKEIIAAFTAHTGITVTDDNYDMIRWDNEMVVNKVDRSLLNANTSAGNLDTVIDLCAKGALIVFHPWYGLSAHDRDVSRPDYYNMTIIPDSIMVNAYSPIINPSVLRSAK